MALTLAQKRVKAAGAPAVACFSQNEEGFSHLPFPWPPRTSAGNPTTKKA